MSLRRHFFVTITLLFCCTTQLFAQSGFQKLRAKSVVYQRADSLMELMISGKYAFRRSFLKPVSLHDGRNSSSFTAAACSYFCAEAVVAATGLELKGTRLNEREARLDWKAVAEYNCAGYSLERSFISGDKDFRVVAAQACTGNAIAETKYLRIDPNNFSGTSWYRVKQRDTDGTFIYSNVVAVKGMSAAPAVQVMPVPSAYAQVRIVLSGMQVNEVVSLRILSAQGRTVAQQNNFRAVNGELLLSAVSRPLPSGTYMLLIQNERVNVKSSFVVIN